MSLLVAGWVAIDEIETPFERREGSLGGSATCAALAASLFTDVRLLAAVGEDFPETMLRALERPRIDLAGLEVIEGGRTSRWGGRYHYDMNSRDTLYTVLGVNERWEPRLPPGWEVSSGLFAAAGDPVLQQRLMAMVPGARVRMVDTIKFFIDGARDELMKAIRAADFVSINESEARELAGMPSIARAGRALLDGGSKAVIVKLGEYGAAYISGEDYFVAPGYPLEEVVDPTGAGDAFAGGFMGYLDSVGVIDQQAIRRAIVYGSTVASFCVEGFGPERLLTLEREEVEQRYRQFRALTHFEVEG
ncbi:PfkB family carbohydrate kinase [Tepidiforma sp.]|uniref:PfkB family carbohydrate kinase n=1 Tax=Tepidiforma sp. TaxID=2682230 RepID=UPI002ADD7B68|nr:PfkB family carbohydrate kinase [Tepidiforma sp.]